MQGAPAILRTLGRSAIKFGRALDKAGILSSKGTQIADKRELFSMMTADEVFLKTLRMLSSPPKF